MSNPSTRTVSLLANEKGASLSKFLICLQQAGGSVLEAEQIAAQHCRTTPTVERFFAAMRTKGAVGPAATAGSTWGNDLAGYGIGPDAYTLLQSASILGRLSPSFRRLPFHVRAAKETGSGAGGAWRGEGLPRPVKRTTTATLQQEHYVADTLVLASQELFRFGYITEAALRTIVINATAKFVDQQLLDPSVSATTGHPASLTNGAAAVTSSGSTAAQIITDLSALIALIESPGDSLVWVMRPLTLATIHAKLAGVGYPTERGYLLGIPTIAGSTSPHQVALIDAAAVAFSSDDTMSVDVTTVADVEMLDSSLVQSGLAGTGASLASLWQLGLVAVRASLDVAWQHIFQGSSSPSYVAGASVMTVTY